MCFSLGLVLIFAAGAGSRRALGATISSLLNEKLTRRASADIQQK